MSAPLSRVSPFKLVTNGSFMTVVDSFDSLYRKEEALYHTLPKWFSHWSTVPVWDRISIEIAVDTSLLCLKYFMSAQARRVREFETLVGPRLGSNLQAL